MGWTSTPFAPLPGFEAVPNYPGYSADFFDGHHYVLLGASWAIDAQLVRRSFRNSFQRHYPLTLAKFRCVYDAGPRDLHGVAPATRLALTTFLIVSVFRGFDQAVFKTIDQGPGRVTECVYPGRPAEARPKAVVAWFFI